MSECVKVMVRCRPMNKKEHDNGKSAPVLTRAGSKCCIQVEKKVNQVILKKTDGQGEHPKAFTYDSVYDWNSTQRMVYDESAFPLVESVLEGYNGTIFAYG